jgi:hypothetical protein
MSIVIEERKESSQMFRLSAAQRALALSGLFMLMVTFAVPAAAQTPAEPPDPNSGNITLTSTFDAVSTYMFRGIRQNGTGIAMWPTGDLGLAVYSGDGGLKSANVNFGIWNSLNTGDTGAQSNESGLGCACGKLWYESDFYATLGLGFGGGVSLGTTYTAYTSPNNGFTTVKELMLKLGVDDSAYLGKFAVKPYVLVAQEFDAQLFTGQADGGEDAGTYMELGIAPGYTGSRASLSVPVKVGLSLANYYELNEGTAAAPDFVDHPFGYFSVAGIVTVPLGGTTNFGAWNVHGGVEFQALGETTKALNGDDGQRVIGSVGFGFSY